MRITASIQESPKSSASILRRCICSSLKVLADLTPPSLVVQHSTQRSLMCPFPSSARNTTGVRSRYRHLRCPLARHTSSRLYISVPSSWDPSNETRAPGVRFPSRPHPPPLYDTAKATRTPKEGLPILLLEPCLLPQAGTLCVADFLAEPKEPCFFWRQVLAIHHSDDPVHTKNSAFRDQ